MPTGRWGLYCNKLFPHYAVPLRSAAVYLGLVMDNLPPFDPEVVSFENFVAAYFWAFNIVLQQKPGTPELEYLEYVAYPTAVKSFNSVGTQRHQVVRKIETGKYVTWIEQRKAMLLSAPKLPKAKAQTVCDKRVPASPNTCQKYRRYDAYFKEQYRLLNNFQKACDRTTAHFHISAKTLERAFSYVQYLNEQQG